MLFAHDRRHSSARSENGMKCKQKLLVAALCITAGIFLLAAQGARAQSVYGAIHGSVTDSTGAVVPGATVTATDTSTGITTNAATDGHGYYIFPQLHIGGPYTVSVSKSGFQSYQSTGLMLNVNANREIDAVLHVGASTQKVQVQAATIQVETSDTQLKTVIGDKAIEQLPLLGRDATILQKTTPGTVESSDAFGTFATNGNQTQENSYLLGGADVNDTALQTAGIVVNPDALAEISIVTSTINPEYSRNSGAIINQVLKSGTNQFHGSGFEFYRDTFLNNGGYFAQERPQYHQNLVGGTLGGPIFKNKVFFFLAYQGIRRGNGVTNLTRVPDKGQIANGDFTNDTNQLTGDTNVAAGLSTNPIPFDMTGTNGPCIADPTADNPETWADCFPNTSGQVVVPVSNYNPIAQKLAQAYVPDPNTNLNGTSYYTFNSPNTFKSDQGIIRIDAHLTQSDTLWASTLFESSPAFDGLSFFGGTLPGFAENDAEHFKIFNASYTHVFNATTLNELRAGYYRFNYAAVEPANVVPPSSFGFSISPQNAGAASVPLMSLTGLFDLGFSPYGPQPRKDENMVFSDNFSKVAGNHNLKFGARVERFVVSNPFYSTNSGDFTFGGTGAFSSGDPLVDFMLGIPDSYLQGSGGFIDARGWELYFYAQDNWKVSNSFTLNYGIASDTETPFENLQFGGLGVICWAPTGQSTVYPTAPPGLLYNGDPGCKKAGGPTTKWNHFAPRVGFAWSPDSGPEFIVGTPGAHEFSLRGGFGVYFNRDAEEAQLQNLEDPPTGLSSFGAADVGGSPSFANPFQDVANRPGLSEPNKFPFTPPPPGSPVDFTQFEPLDLSSISPNYTVPYTYNFNLNVQRALPSDMLLQIAYVGSLGRKLPRAYEADHVTAAGHAACVADPTCLHDPNNANYFSLAYPQYFVQPGVNIYGIPHYASVGRPYTDGASSYNSLQVQLIKQATHNLYFSVAYTYSHSLDNASGLESSGFNGLGTNWVPGFQYLSYGDSDYDARQRIVFLYNYGIPLFHSWNDHVVLREALGGWHITGITALQTGFPIPMYESGTNSSLYCNGYGVTYYSCPDVPETSTFNIPTMNPRKAGNYWFNPAPFSPEPLGTFGNVKRNFLHGPGYNYTDLSLYKDFPLGPRGTSRIVQLRVESYNVFNHANFALPDGNFSDGPQFGQITSVIQPSNAGGDPQPGRVVQLAGKFYF
jgi:hypothetical protein